MKILSGFHESTFVLHLFFVIILQFDLVFSQSQENSRPKIGIVLSGGAAKGIAHIGALKVIEEAGLPVDYIGGTSMGGIMAGLYAIGYNASELEKIALNQDWNTSDIG